MKTGTNAEIRTASNSVVRGALALFNMYPTLPAKTAEDSGVAISKVMRNLLLIGVVDTT